MGCFSADTPPDRNYYTETSATLADQIKLAPELFAAQSKFAPQYAALNSQITRDTLLGTNGQPGLLNLYENALAPANARIQSAAEKAQRLADVTAVEQLGGRAVTAFREADPRREALMSALNEQAMGDLAAGSALDPETRRQLEQQVRAGQAQRGFGLGPVDLFEEAMTTGLAGQQRKQQRLQNVFSVAGLNANSSIDPFMAILGRSAMSPQSGQNQVSTAAGFLNSGPTLFNPESGYSQDLYNTNYNARAAALINAQNASAGLWGAGIGALGRVGGGLLGFCWVAREVYGEDNIRWIWYRNWLMNDAPGWFRWLYGTFGEWFAAWLHRHPGLKPRIRAWMDARIGNRGRLTRRREEAERATRQLALPRKGGRHAL